MSTTTLDQAAERRKRIEAERRRRPESDVWLRVLTRALDAAEQPVWSSLRPRLPSARHPDAPLLHEAFVAVDRGPAGRLVRGLLKAAASAGGGGAESLASLRGRAVEPVELLAAAAAEDTDRLAASAERAGAAPAAFVAVGRLAALPLLRGCADALAAKMPAGWSRGYCPACGGWPAVAELRGLERRRVLRCARCATGWELPVLVCPFCDERDHARQVTLAPEGEENRRRVDACRTCRGYVKTLTTLAPLRPWAVPLEDLATIEMDLAVQERGFAPPAAPGFAPAVRVVAADGPLARFRGGWA